MSCKLALSIALAFFVSAETASAHHSFQMFDQTKSVTLEGTVKEFQWANPHVFLELNVIGADGKVVNYSLENSAPGTLRRRGWRITSLKPGDKVTVVMAPLRSGQNGGLMRTVTKQDGTVLK